MEGGHSQPHYPQESGQWIRRLARKTQRSHRLSTTAVDAGSGKSSGKRGVLSFCRNTPTPKAAQPATKAVPRSPQQASDPRRPGERGSRATPGAGDRSGRDPSRRASRPSRGHPDGGGPGRRTQVRYVPDAAPRRADRDPGPRRRGSEVPAATPFAPGFPAVENVPHDVVTLFWRPRITSFRDNDLRDHHGGAELRACRSGYRRSKPVRHVGQEPPQSRGSTTSR